MRPFIKSVSGVFKYKNEIFGIFRKKNQKAFPGYYSFPGGKIEEKDHSMVADCPWTIDPTHWQALKREIVEELGIEIDYLIEKKQIKKIQLLSKTLTPAFGPMRFENYLYEIILTNKNIDFKLCEKEIESGSWNTPQEILNLFNLGELTMVPPTRNLLTRMANGDDSFYDYNYDIQDIVPVIECLGGIFQFMPLTNTFPPANRTNAYYLKESKILIDPSTKSDEEMNRFLFALKNYDVDKILLSHHHPDHHERLVPLAKELNVPLAMSRDTHERTLKKYGANYFLDLPIIYWKEGDMVGTYNGEELKVYEVPGHDEGQLALAPDSYNWFFVGDLIQTVGTVVVGGDEGDMSKYFSSLSKVITMAPKVILPSHGIVIGGTFKLEETLIHRKMREKQIIALMKEGKNPDEILAVVYEGLDSRLHKYAMKTIEAHQKRIIQLKLLD